jgi:hypothetical protein
VLARGRCPTNAGYPCASWSAKESIIVARPGPRGSARAMHSSRPSETSSSRQANCAERFSSAITAVGSKRLLGTPPPARARRPVGDCQLLLELGGPAARRNKLGVVGAREAGDKVGIDALLATPVVDRLSAHPQGYLRSRQRFGRPSQTPAPCGETLADISWAWRSPRRVRGVTIPERQVHEDAARPPISGPQGRTTESRWGEPYALASARAGPPSTVAKGFVFGSC